MKLNNMHVANVNIVLSAAAILLPCMTIAAQISQTAPAPNQNITAPAPQKHGPPAGPQQPIPGTIVPRQILQNTGAGTIEGFVYWDRASISHTPASSCSGLAVTVAVGNSTGGKSTGYQSLATLSNNFKYVGQVKQFLTGGKIKVYDVCTYGYSHVPVGPDLRVTVLADTASLSQPGPFSPMSVPQKDPLGPITIINGQCNMLPHIVNPTASDLFSHWGTCQNMAYDVNFMMQPATQVLNSRPTGVSSEPLGNQMGMLSGARQQGMLAPGTTQSATSPGNQGTLLGDSQPPASQNGGLQNPGTKAELDSQPLPLGQGSNVGALQSTRSGPAGNVEGYVLWDTSLIQYKLSTPCQGLQVIVVDMGNNSQPTLASSNNLTPLWSAPQLNSAISNQNYSGPTSKGPWMVCHYSFGQLPEREALEVRANVTQSSAFSPPVTPAKVTGSTGTQFTIPPGNCNTRRARSTLFTILGSFIDFCGEHAFNVNIELFPAGVGSLGSLPANSVVQNVASAGGGAMLNSSSNQGGMLSGAQQPGTLLGNRQASPAPSRQPQGPGSKVSPNPQPLPPGAKGAASAQTKLQPMKLAPPTALRRLTNPYLSQQNTSIIAVLEQQRQAAAEDAAAMRAGAGTIARASAARTSALSANVQGNRVPALGAQTVQSSNNVASKIAQVPAFNSVVLTCSTDPTPRILRVNGGQASGIFTPEAKYNQYTIVGCSFGQSDPGISAYIFGVNGFKANLNIDFWSDNAITAHLDPWLAGVLDQDNVTLVVAPAGKQPFNKSGYKLQAARGMPAPDGSDQEVQLAYNSMPRASVSLFDASPVLAGYDQVPPSGTWQFPSFSFQGSPVAGWVFRYAYGYRETYSGVVGADCFINDVGYQITSASDHCWPYFSGSPTLGSDTWDFSKLVPGFVISTYSLYYEDIDPTQLCGSWDDFRKNSGLLLNWDFNLTAPTQITVDWPLYWCRDTELPPSGRINEQKQSVYGLAVWVMGPRCVDAWTGQKDQNCMNKVKQILS